MVRCYFRVVTRTSSEQKLVLDSMTAGVKYMLVITKSPGASTLEFKHLDDPDPIAHPAHSAVATATVITEFLCPSSNMALVFAAPPGAPYHVSVLPVTAHPL